MRRRAVEQVRGGGITFSFPARNMFCSKNMKLQKRAVLLYRRQRHDSRHEKSIKFGWGFPHH